MLSNAGQPAYGNPVWGNPAWGTGPAGLPPWDGQAYFSALLRSRAFWIALVVLGFIAWWPIGLALLFFTLGTKGMRCRTGYGDWHRWGGGPWAGCQRDERAAHAPPSGNRAFDEYRAETLRRLEDEQREFAAFLDRLRFAKDKAEFDEFMASRRQPPAPPETPPAN